MTTLQVPVCVSSDVCSVPERPPRAAMNNGEEWIDEAIERQSLPLLGRVDIALRLIAARGSTEAAHWADAIRKTRVQPAFKGFPQLH
ncbi:hypothetical protein [Mesorhizobium waimense]|nr:hypothetical protein [Mesorhizobium waimense]